MIRSWVMGMFIGAGVIAAVPAVCWVIVWISGVVT